MNQQIAINGVGVVGGFGCGVQDLQGALQKATCAPDIVDVKSETGPIPAPVFRADTRKLSEYVSKRVLRRIDHYSRLAILGAYLALDDAGQLDADRENMGVVIASGYGASKTMFDFMDSVIDDGDPLASPIKFSNSVHNAAAAHVSILLKAKGPTLTVSQFEMSVPSALFSACQWILQKRVSRVLFGGIDEYCDVLGYCHEKMFPRNHGSRILPLDHGRQTAIAGEGAAFFLLSNDDQNQSPYGNIMDIQLGHLKQGHPGIPGGAVAILGSDGHMECGRWYEGLIPKGSSLRAYSPMYGSMPAGMALDMAAAALCNKSEKLFPQPGSDQNIQAGGDQRERLDGRPLCCIKTGRYGEYGMITMGR